MLYDMLSQRPPPRKMGVLDFSHSKREMTGARHCPERCGRNVEKGVEHPA